MVVRGMSSTATKHLNGLTGVICKHPRQGHPCFVRKFSASDIAQLTVCVSFTNPTVAKVRSALLQPRFLEPYHDVVLSTTDELSETVAVLAASKRAGETEPLQQA